MGDLDVTRDFYEASYRKAGFAAQRKYPNEELLRFIGRSYFQLPREERSSIRILEVGCGSGANLWMLASEAFEAHGIDLSSEALDLARQLLASAGTSATLRHASMTDIPYPSEYFDVVVDVFSSNCLDEMAFTSFSKEIARVMRPKGFFFSYTPSKKSDVFKFPGPSKFLDASTLDGIRRPDAPYFGNFYPFRFSSPEDVTLALKPCGLEVISLERIGRTYRGCSEYFEFLSYVAAKV